MQNMYLLQVQRMNWKALLQRRVSARYILYYSDHEQTETCIINIFYILPITGRVQSGTLRLLLAFGRARLDGGGKGRDVLMGNASFRLIRTLGVHGQVGLERLYRQTKRDKRNYSTSNDANDQQQWLSTRTYLARSPGT
jgi:hypothetical protein